MVEFEERRCVHGGIVYYYDGKPHFGCRDCAFRQWRMAIDLRAENERLLEKIGELQLSRERIAEERDCNSHEVEVFDGYNRNLRAELEGALSKMETVQAEVDRLRLSLDRAIYKSLVHEKCWIDKCAENERLRSVARRMYLRGYKHGRRNMEPIPDETLKELGDE